ncbi:MAG: hypothetical protein P9L94_00445 [Candidatus Hinthialibacter antarcticus]|nr:hypothetical protein [Candidatus Hinthialibacter antarcticus]
MLRTIVTSVFTLLLSVSVAVAQPYEIKNIFRPGAVTFLTLDTYIQGAMQSQAGAFPIEATNSGLFRYEIQNVLTTGAVCNVKLEKMEMFAPMAGHREPLDMIPILAKEDAAFDLTMKTNGEVVKNSKQLDLGAVLPGLDQVGLSPIQIRPYMRLPNGPAKINDVWSESWVVPHLKGSKPIIAYATYSLRKIEERDGVRTAVIESETTINAENVQFDPVKSDDEAPPQIQLTLNYKSYVMRGTGEWLFDLEKGRLTSMKDDTRTELEMAGSSNLGGMSFPTEYTMTLRVRNAGVSFDSMPEWKGAAPQE